LIIKQQQEETQRIKEEIEKAGAILEQKKSWFLDNRRVQEIGGRIGEVWSLHGIPTQTFQFY
jgi:hypothetical protein